MIRPLTKKRHVTTSFDSQQVKGSQTLVKSSWEHFYHIFPSRWGEIISIKSPWSKLEIIGVFVNTWTADYMYPVPDFENLKFSIQMQLSSEQKTFSQCFIPFMESPSNLKHFRKKEDFHSQCISKINDRLRLGWTTH